MQDRAAQVLIQDDGELGALRVLLDEIGVSYRESMPERANEVALLFSTPRHALRLGSLGSALPPSTTHIVLADSITNTTRAQLHRFDCQYVVDEAFHAEAMQLLILHSLYRGPERRKSSRIALGEEVKLKIGWRSQSVTLIQLSDRGCGVLCEWDGKHDKPITVTLPKSLTGGSPMPFTGRVVGRGVTTCGENTVSIAFSGLTPARCKTLQGMMKRHALGDFQMSPVQGRKPGEAKESKKPRATAARKASESGSQERRRSPRAEYDQRVLASGDGRARALIGRDLSVGGMLVEPNEDLVPGEKVKLVLFGKSGTEPIVVRALVLRDNGDTGIALRFEDVSDETRARLEKLMGALPLLSGGAPGSQSARDGRPLVVSELLERH